MENNPALTETIRFICKFDTFFDIMNVRSLDESILKRKPDLRPFRSISDNTFKVHNMIKYYTVHHTSSFSFMTVVEG